MSEYLISQVRTYDSIVDDGLVPNLSDHLHVRLSVSLDFMTSTGTDLHRRFFPVSYKASVENLSCCQQLATSYLLCIAVLNEKSASKANIETFCRQMVNASVKAIALAIPRTNNYQTRRRLPGWYEVRSPLHKSGLLFNLV